MFQDRDGETELLLGNKQLLGIFFLIVVLFAVFFAAGYMMGRNSGENRIADSTPPAKSVVSDTQASTGSGESHDVAPDPSTAGSRSAAAQDQDVQPSTRGDADASPNPVQRVKTPDKIAPASKQVRTQTAESGPARNSEPSAATSAPADGHSTYLQVAALSRNEADAVAKVLSKKGFRARIAPKPGTQWYRVLVGPMRDAGDLNATRDALKNKGFREVFVQHL
jgi:DedD protein